MYSSDYLFKLLGWLVSETVTTGHAEFMVPYDIPAEKVSGVLNIQDWKGWFGNINLPEQALGICVFKHCCCEHHELGTSL